MAELRVVNASPLIALAKVERLDLLTRGGRQLVVPAQVAGEVLAGPERDPACLALEGGFGAPFRSTAVDPEVLGWSLGAGESAVLSAARSMGAIAILDDQDARSAARAGHTADGDAWHRCPKRTSGSFRGHIASAAQLIRELRDAGLRLDDRAVAGALSHALGESWEH